MAENQKIFKQIGGVNIDQSAMCYYISMDLSWQVLQTNESSFQIFEFFF